MKIYSSQNKNTILGLILREYYNETMKYCPLPQEIGDAIWYKYLKQLQTIDPKIHGFFINDFNENNKTGLLLCRNFHLEYKYGVPLK